MCIVSNKKLSALFSSQQYQCMFISRFSSKSTLLILLRFTRSIIIDGDYSPFLAHSSSGDNLKQSNQSQCKEQLFRINQIICKTSQKRTDILAMSELTSCFTGFCVGTEKTKMKSIIVDFSSGLYCLFKN